MSPYCNATSFVTTRPLATINTNDTVTIIDAITTTAAAKYYY